MDDHLRGWMWTRPGDDRYCDALPMENSDADSGEPYVDSLRQLNKIVERILPEKSPLSLVSMRPKLDIPMSLKRSFADHKDFSRELPSRKPSSVSSGLTEISMDSPVKHPPLSTMPSVCFEDSLRLKALRPSDSLNDSAYETYCGDASNDAVDSIDKTTRADELSSGTDPADYCISPSGRKSEDDSKPLCCGKEKEAEVISGGGDLLISGNFSGDVDCDRTRSKSLGSAVSLETERDQDKEGEKTEPCLAEAESKQLSLRLTDRLLTNKCQNGSHCDTVLGSSDLSTVGKLPELGRYVADNSCWTGSNLSIHVSTSLHAAKLGSTPSSSDSVPQGSLLTDASHASGRRIGNMREGANAGAGDEEVKSFTCPHCAYAASKKGQVRKHLSVHGIFLCAHCEFACDRADLLEEHRHIRHPGLCGRRLCKKCRVLFQSSELEAHERQCSGEKQRWACHTCGKEFKFLSVMKAHAHKWHPPVDDGTLGKPADNTSDTASSKPCSVSSGTTSTTLNPTQSDAVSGTEIKQFQCSECGKLFKTKWTLSNHALSHAGADTPFCCDVDGCSGVTFRSDKELNCHRMAVHRLGPTKYECSHPGCTMQFAKYGHFKRHQLTHAASVESELSSTDASERRFVCDWTRCGKAFSHPDSLRVHYRRHTDEKPHHCHHCEAAYRQKSGLKYHLEKVHGEKTVGRCGRKRKLTMENTSHQIPPTGAFMSSKTGQLHCEVESMSGQTMLSDRDSITVNVKHSALSKVREINISMSDLQTKQRSKSDTGRRLSLPESSSQDCDDNLENIDINDEWLLDEDDGFISAHRQPSEAGVSRNAEDGDREQAGSTSDTEPLDEDICEELRKLSDAINSEVLSPRGLDSMSSPFDSPAAAAYVAAKSDCVGNFLPDMSSAHRRLFQGIGNHEGHAGVFDHFLSTPLPRDSGGTNDFYPRHPEVTAAAVNANSSGVLAREQCTSGTSDRIDTVNGYLPDGYGCPDVHPTHFDRNTSASESTHLPADGLEIVEPASYHSAPFEDSVNPWSVVVNSSRWSSDTNDNPAFIPTPSVSSVSVCSSAETALNDQVGRDDGRYSNLMSAWSAAENSQQWLGHGGILPGWSQPHLPSVAGQPDVSRRYDWHVGQHAESAFSRTGATFEGRISFDTSHQSSPKPCMPYRTDLREVSPMSDHFVDSLPGKQSGVYPASNIGHTGSWADLYGRSSHMPAIGNYEYSLPTNLYRSPVQSDHFYLTSGYSGIQSHAGYERGIEMEGSYGTYRIPPMHATSWPVPGLSNAGKPLRPMTDPQPSSVLYNVVPRYY